MNDSVYIHGISMRFYRGIGPTIQKINPLSKFNFFVGKNNSGKSILLNFLNEYFNYVDDSRNEPEFKINPLYEYRGKVTGIQSVEFYTPISLFRDKVHERFPTHGDGAKKELLDKLIRFIVSDNGIWFERKQRTAKINDDEHARLLADFNNSGMTRNEWQNLWYFLTGRSAGNLQNHWVPDSIRAVVAACDFVAPSVKLIPAFRRIGDESSSFDKFNGSGLINRFAVIQSPDHNHREDRLLFDKINNFVQNVTGYRDAIIEVPHNRNHLLLHIDNKVLPLDLLGTGIHHVIMIAAFCTITRKSIICMEEPEIHLHPLLQRQLISYLDKNTDNQYFIATHSAALIDQPGASLFHVSNNGVETHVNHSLTSNERSRICTDLGYKASDIVQANFVIWVEGPSDRIYVKRWIEIVDSSLVEGIHYSIMFYGGRLLSHLALEPADIDDFISLKKLNRNVAILIDSDKRTENDVLNSTKQRILDEFDSNGNICWITHGREIENYISRELLESALKKLYESTFRGISNYSIFSNVLQFNTSSCHDENETSVKKKVDKVALAREIIVHIKVLDSLDLKERIDALVGQIKAANA